MMPWERVSLSTRRGRASAAAGCGAGPAACAVAGAGHLWAARTGEDLADRVARDLRALLPDLPCRASGGPFGAGGAYWSEWTAWTPVASWRPGSVVSR